jgi:uncharacterized protein DUF4905
MKLKKTFSFSDKNQIWRLLISNTDKLIIETRDTDKKEVFFHCIDLINGKKVFKNFQLEDKFWVGIEAIHKDRIIFHKFAKPNMPEHKGIIVFDIVSQKIIWENNDLAFLSVVEDKVYAFKRKFEGRDIYSFNYNTGEIIDDLGNDINKVTELLSIAQNNEDFSNYIYPEQISGLETPEVKAVIDDEVKGKDIIENIEMIKYDNFMFFNYYLKNENNLLDNVFVVYNIDKKKKVSSEVINKNLNSFTPDSFFCYKNNLLLLKNKNEIVLSKVV